MRLLTWLASVGCVVSLGCSRDSQQRLAHFFFEIPEPDAGGEALVEAPELDAEPPAVGPSPALVAMQPTGSRHRPFMMRECVECHDSAARMRVRDDFMETCEACHDAYFSDRVGHFPVQEGMCLECHEMHRTPYAALLKMAEIDVCIECHDPPEDLSAPAHAVEGVELCSACHDAHFGESPLLKPNPTLAVPTASDDETSEDDPGEQDD